MVNFLMQGPAGAEQFQCYPKKGTITRNLPSYLGLVSALKLSFQEGALRGQM